MPTNPTLTISVDINAPVTQVWERYTNPTYIVQWNHASDDWICPRVENDLRVGGRFTSRMEAKDGSVGFDFYGTYTTVKPYEQIDYTMGDGRTAQVLFQAQGDQTRVVINFQAEEMNSLKMQQDGW